MLTTLFALVIQLAAAVAALVAPPVNADHHYPVCEADAEGRVWQFWTDDDFGCDVVPPQELWLTGVPAYAIDDCIEGTYTAYADLDPDDGWDDNDYGDCRIDY